MDNIAAIQWLTRQVKFLELVVSRTNNVSDSIFKHIEVARISVEAIGKQVAKPVKVVDRNFSKDCYCPVCGKQQKYNYKTRREGCFCERCGQRLTFPKWEEKSSEVTEIELVFR